MKQGQLEQYTKNHAHHGVNCLSILQNFKKYIEKSADPQNIFRYMQEKAICTFLPQYWIHKAEYLFEIGNFSGCSQCMEQAQSRNGIGQDDNERIIDINHKEQELLNRIINQMKSYPLKTKRTVEEFNILTSPNIMTPIEEGKSQQKYIKILAFYDEKYGSLRRDKEKRFKGKREKLPQSWLAQVYEKEQIQQKKIEEKIHQNSVKLSREVKYHSMHTPLKSRDPQRLTKTMDSVQILRKKRSTNEKSRKHLKLEKDDSQTQFDQIERSHSKMISSVPVGKCFRNLKRRVTFQMINSLNEKVIKQKQSSAFSNSQISNIITTERNTSDLSISNEQLSNQFLSLPNPPQRLQ